MEVIELLNLERIWILREKETFKYLEILEVDAIKLVEIKERIKKKTR